MINEDETTTVQPAEIPEATFTAAFEAALRFVKYRSRGRPQEDEETLTDAATDGLIWARANATSAETFAGFAAATVRRFCFRRLGKAMAKRARRPITELTELTRTEAKPVTPAGPALIDDLPEDIQFAIRLYFTDGYSLRDCCLLMNKSPNTVDLMLKRAAELLAPGRIKPSRRNGEKRLTRGWAEGGATGARL